MAEYTGFHGPAYAKAQGRVFLAFLAEDELDHYLRTTELRALTPETLTNPESLRVALATIRDHFYAVASNQAVLGATAIAAPVFGIQGQVLATISLVWFTPELVPRIEELGAALRDAGLQISAELGFRVPLPWYPQGVTCPPDRIPVHFGVLIATYSSASCGIRYGCENLPSRDGTLGRASACTCCRL